MTSSNPEQLFDLVVIGAGPAGLSASITAESERINTVLIDSIPRLGGQAVTTSMIENYPGFPNGISGDELMGRFIDQASRFKTDFRAPNQVTHLERTESGIRVVTSDSETFLGRAALLSTGVDNRSLKARNLVAYLGRGATYGPPDRKLPYHNGQLFVVGGANSAGQAAINLSDIATCTIHMLVRGGSIEEKMSGYLVDQVTERKNIIVHTNTELIGVDGNGVLDKVTVKTGEVEQDMEASEVFVLIGSEPKTEWLKGAVALDKDGFIKAGSDLSDDERGEFIETTKGRAPLGHETSIPGLFVAGDARCGTYKRVALASGDGIGVVPELHRLRELQSAKK